MFHHARLIRFAQLLLLSGACARATAVQPTFNPRALAVELSAAVQSSPPTIDLRWPGDPWAISFELSRKARQDQTWTPLVTLGGSSTNYTDSDVADGATYEYEIIKRTSSTAPPYSGYGYIYAGMNVPMIERRGTVILIVENTPAADLSGELDRLRQDLIGDGWAVIRHDVSPDDSVQSVKALIKADYLADSQNVKAVLLFGRVPIPYSGDIKPDGHENHRGAWPADAYYGEMDGEWTDAFVNSSVAERPINWNVPGDGKFDQSTFSSDVDLQVGRVDLSNMTAFSNVNPPRSEKDLLRQYLNKSHNFRHGLLPVARRAVVDDNFGLRDNDSDAPSGSGWRNFAAFFGAENVSEVGFDQFFPTVTSQSFLWAYGSGGGSYYYASGIGTAKDFALQDPRIVFTMFLGSYLGDWNNESNFLRAALGSTTYTLTSCFGGFPHYFFHHMALGETIGFGLLLSQNNKTNGLYRPQAQGTYQVHITLLGDPTLRLHPVIPPNDLTASVSETGVALNWRASVDTDLRGYHVYRAASPAGPFVRLNGGALITSTGFADAPPSGRQTYMVRAVKLDRSGSGTYFNFSQGIFASVQTGSDPTEPPPLSPPSGLVAVANGPTSVTLTWDQQAAGHDGYKVERELAARRAPVELATLPGQASSYEDNSCHPGGRYVYRVRAFNRAGAFASSNDAEVTTPWTTPQPAFPRIVSGKSRGSTFDLWVEGKIGQMVVLQVTSNFVGWSSILSRTLDSSPVRLEDNSTLGVSYRFYRLQSHE